MTLKCRLLGHDPSLTEERWPIEEYECKRCGARGLKVVGAVRHGTPRIKWE